MLHKGSIAAFVGILSLGVAGKVGAQTALKYPGCADVTQSNFKAVTVLDHTKDPSLDEVIRFAVSKDGSVYFNERAGTIKVVKPNGSVVKLGKINVNNPANKLNKPKGALNGNINNEFGLVGFTLDHDFENTHYIYVDYQAAATDVTNLSRFTLNGDVLDLASEKIMLSWPVQKDYCCHTGGDIRIDSKGDLWMSVGNNTMNRTSDNDALAYVDESIPNSEADDQGHAANSNDYRGKILHIHPTADGKYTIPAGNFKDAFASMYSAADLAKIKPEIFAMGERNPYTIAVDDLTGRVAWGEVGPDNGWDTEEYNILAKPAFTGWPYFSGAEGNPHYQYKLAKDPAAPMNTSTDNTGVQKLPPATGATIGYRESCAITGPIYRYSAAQTSAAKLPAHFDGKWFVTDWQGDVTFKLVTLDASGVKVASQANFMASTVSGFRHPLELYVGADGILYGLDYGSGYHFNGTGGTDPLNGSDNVTKIVRFEYTGAACAVPVSLKDQAIMKAQSLKSNLLNLGLAGDRSVLLPLGASAVRLYDLQGKMVWESPTTSAAIGDGKKLAVPASVGNGVYRAKFVY